MTTEAASAALETQAVDRLTIVVANGSFGEASPRLAEHFDTVELRFGDVSDPDKLSEMTAGASGVVVALQPLRSAHIAALAPSVRVIGRAGVGVDTIDLDAAAAAGITVVNQPTYGTKEVASHAVALLLALATTGARDGYLCTRRVVGPPGVGTDETARRGRRRAYRQRANWHSYS